MKGSQHPLFLVSNYLNEKDRFSLSQVNRTLRESLRTNQQGPYSKKTFSIATSQLFNSKENFNTAWVVYYKTAHSTHSGPAIIYKLNELFKLTINDTLTKFGGLAYINATGQCYGPDKHFWNANLCWVLAQIHVNRPFVILSEISQWNVYHHLPLHSSHSPACSTFAKEIAAAYKAGYRVNCIERTTQADGSEHFEIMLKSIQPNLNQLTITDIDPTEQDVQLSIEHIIECDRQYKQTILAVKELLTLFDDIKHDYSLHDLLDHRSQMIEKATQCIEQLFIKTKHRNLALETFIREFNNDLPDGATKLNSLASNMSDNKDTLRNIQNAVISSLSTTIENQIIKKEGEIEEQQVMSTNSIRFPFF
ncbi:MAG: hypothetical protein A3F11_09070 [Gammaproteobacteria bacterium RIFCSPHIGHO2_12_FULL_37_14]|nr:MAG: hypothetical protein A3F11_09070 [Gammaproteobacteria bacterium RIFCSPHIGHO2_12_FULL_37_14]